MTRARPAHGVRLMQGILLVALTVLAAESVQAQSLRFFNVNGPLSVTEPPASSIMSNALYTYTVTLIGAPLAPDTVLTWDITHGSTTDADFGATSGPVTFAAGSAVSTFSVSIVRDIYSEIEETFMVGLRRTDSTHILGSPVTVRIATNAGTTGRLASIGDANRNVLEGTTLLVPITMVGEVLPGTSAVSYSITGTATTADYEVVTQVDVPTITFDPGTGTGTIAVGTGTPVRNLPIRILSDSIMESAETLIVRITNHDAQGVSVHDPAPRTYSIVDRVRTLNLSGPTTHAETNTDTVLSYAVAIGAGGMTFSAPTEVTWTVTHDGTSNDDLGALTGTTTFPTETQFTLFTIPVTGDTLNEAAEAFTVTVTIADPAADGGTTIGSAASVTTTITDDDTITVAIGDIPTVSEGATARFPLTLTGGVRTADVILTYTLSGTGIDAADFTDLTGITGQTFTIPQAATPPYTLPVVIADEGAADEPEELTLTLTGASSVGLVDINMGGDPNQDATAMIVTSVQRVVADPTVLNVSEDSGMATYAMRLLTQPGGPVTVTPESGDMAVATVTGALTFTTANWNTAQSVTVTGVADADAVTETVGISHTVSGYGRAPADEVTVTVTDNDTAGVTVSATALTVEEGATGIYTVVLATIPGGAVTVTPESGDMAVATVVGALTFTTANWNTGQTFTVTAAEDDDGNDDTATITHAVSGYGSVATAAEITVAVTDNDTAGVTVSATALTVEEGATGIYTVVLATLPGGAVTVTPASGDMAVATVAGALTFTTANWNDAQTVTVTTAEDGNVDDDTATITHVVDGYGSVTTAAEVTVAVTDNDTAGVAVSVETLTVEEGATGIYTVVLATLPGGAVTVTPASGDMAVATVAGALTFTTANWNDAQTVTVTAAEDGNVDDDTATITHVVDGYGSVTTAAEVTVAVTDNDTAGVTVSATALTVEEGATGIYTVVLATLPGGAVTVTPASGDMAVATVAGALTFTVANWNTGQTFTVTAAEDDDGNDDTATITHAVSGYGSVTTAAEVTVAVTDNDTAGVTVSATALTVEEGATGIYTVVLATLPGGAVTVTPASGDMAVATVAGALTFTVANWNDAQTVTVTAAEDGNVDDDTATITHVVDGYGSVTTAAEVTVAVTDNDTDGVAVSVETLTVEEGATGIYTVVLATLPGGAVTVTPASGDMAVATVVGALTFTVANWNTGQTFTVTAAEDDDGNDDTATITHAVSGYGSVTTAAEVTVAVTDNDTAGVTVSATALTVEEGATGIYTVVLATLPGGAVTVTPASGDMAVATVVGALTFTVANWNTGQTFTVTAAEDDDGNDDTATITHAVSGYGSVATAAEITVAVTDNDTAGVTVSATALTVEEGATGIYTVVLATLPGGAVTVTPESGDMAVATVVGALTFTVANWNTGQTFTVTAAEDDDGNDDTATITHAVSGYGSVATVAEITVAVTDNDTAGVTVSATALTVEEGATGIYTVVLATLPGGAVTVTPASGDMAVATVVGALTFTVANWNTGQTFTVTAAEDDDGNDDTATITHVVSGYGSVATAAEITVAVTDNDTAGVTVSATALTVAEGDTGIYTVALGTIPDGAVTVTPASGDMAVATVTGALTFTTANWNDAQTVTVTAAEDADANDATATITHAVSGYGSLTTAAAVTVTVTDNDTAEVTVSVPTLTVAEGDTGIYTVALGTIPDGAVTVTPASGDMAVATVAGALTFTTANWNDAQTVTVTVAEDADANDATATITHAVSGYGSVATAEVAVTVTDNDTAGVTVSATALTVEEGDTGIYTVVLATLPGGAVTVTPASGDTAVATVVGALTFTAANWNTAQTVSVVAAEDDDGDDATATITHAVSGYGSVTTAAEVTVTVTDNDTAEVAVSVATLTVEEGDTGTYTVVLATIPDGAVTVTPTVSGSPGTTITGALTFRDTTWNVAQTVTITAGTDTDTTTDTATITHAVTGYGAVATADAVTVTITDTTRNVPDFGAAMVDDQTYTLGAAIPTLTLPEAAGGDGAMSYTLTGGLPDGLTYTGTARTLAGTPTAAVSAVTLTYTVSDADSDTTAADEDVLTFAVTVTDTSPNVPDFGAAMVDDQTYTIGAAIPTLTLPEAAGGDGDLSYALTGDLPDGLTYTGRDRTLVGTPTTVAPAVMLTYTVSDTDSDTTAGDENVLTFAVTVTVAPVAPLAVTIAPTALTVNEGAMTTYTVVLATRPGGNVTVTPASGDTAVATVTGALTFSVATWNTAQTVTVTAAGDNDGDDATVTISHAVSASGAVVTADPVTVTVTDTNRVPEFGTARVANQRYTVDVAVSLMLPTASGGDGALSYTLTDNLPDGLTFDDTARTLTGTPTIATPTTRLTYTATDADSSTASLTFTVAVVDSDTVKAQRAAANHVILPEVARVIADQGVSAVARRIRQAGADSVDADQTLTLGGQSTLAGMLTTHGRALAEGTFNLQTMLGGSEFVLPLNAREVAPGTGLSAITLWGGGDYRALSGKDDAINWDGNMFSAQLGADARLRDDLLAGVAVSWSEADLDYTGSGSGDYEVGLTSVHPYVGWTAMGGRLDLWATAGYGWGELEINSATAADADSQQAASDVTMQTIGAGGSAQVLESHAATLRVKGEALQTTMDVEGSEGIAAVMIEARRLRLGLEASHTHRLAGGSQLVPTLEVGMRHDAGDGRTGTGAEVGGGLRYTDAARGLTVESHGRVLVGHSGDYQDWGVGGAVRLETGHDGQGLSFSLQPTWGATASRASQVWAQEAATTVAAASTPARQNGQVDMNLGYGLGWDEMLVTPYSQVTLTNGSARAYRLGSRMRFGGGMTLNLEGIREETAARLVNHGIRLQFGVSDRTTLSLEGTRQETATQAFNHGINLKLGLSF